MKKLTNKLSRREFVKYSDLVGAVLGIGGADGAGYFLGKSKESCTGWGKNAYWKTNYLTDSLLV